jgi:hypothetical protein
MGVFTSRLMEESLWIRYWEQKDSFYFWIRLSAKDGRAKEK